MKAKINVWLESDGQVALSAWRIQLLNAIAETGSISQAAKKMNIPYRRAWEKIQECEAQWGFSLVETHTGGTGGGGTQLTPACQDLIVQYHLLTKGIENLLQQRFEQLFASVQSQFEPSAK